MKNYLKRCFSLLLAAAMVFCLLPQPAQVSAAPVPVTTESQMIQRFVDLSERYRHGEYWNWYNVYNGQVEVDAKSIKNNRWNPNIWGNEEYYGSPAGTGTEKCPTMACSGYCTGGGEGTCNCICGSFAENQQCAGYAYKMYWLTWDTVSFKEHYNIDNLCAGDIVAYYTGGGSHTIFVTKVVGDTVYYTECNNSGPCQVEWNQITTKGAISGSGIKHIRHCTTNNNWDGVEDCSHSYNNVGICTGTCKGEYPWQSTLKTGCAGIYAVSLSGGIYLRNKPYSASTKISELIKVGTKVEVLGIVTNHYKTDNEWYKVSYNGVVGYTHSSNLTWSGPIDNTPKAPQWAVISVDKAVYAVDEAVNFTFDTDAAPGCNSLWVYCPNGDTLSYANLYDSYTLRFGMAGDYEALVQAWNSVGSLCSSRVQFTVKSPHTHSYSSKVTKSATCTVNGVRTYTCSCGSSYTESIPATGHSYGSWTTTQSATCTTTGTQQRKCSKCGTTQTQSIAKIDHLYGSDNLCFYCDAKNPYAIDFNAYNVELSSSKQYIFQNVSSGKRLNVPASLLWKWDDNQYHDNHHGGFAVAYTADGSVDQNFTVSERKTNLYSIHPSALSAGYLLQVYSNEGAVTSGMRIETNPASSSYGSWQLFRIVPVSTTEFVIVPSSNSSVCMAFNSASEAATNFSWVYVNTYVGADYQKWHIYESNGTQVKATKGCSHSLSHVNAKSATCTTSGNKEYWYCSACGKYFSSSDATTETTKNAVTIAAKGHSLTRYPEKAATCTATGNKEYWYCSTCGKYYRNSSATSATSASAVKIDALGHDYSEYVCIRCAVVDSTVIKLGICGDNLTWTLNLDTGSMLISGSGDFYDYGDFSPWFDDYRTEIKTVKIEKGVTGIGKWAFYDCTSLTTVDFEGSEAGINIGHYAFNNCTSLTTVNFGDCASSIGIGNYAFYNCDSLSAIEIPDVRVFLYENTFGNCDRLTAVYFEGNAPETVGNGAFDKETVTLYYIPSKSFWTYGEAYNAEAGTWNGYNLRMWEEKLKVSGICGNDVTWSLDMNTGKLIVDGTGAMKNYEPHMSGNQYIMGQPWESYRRAIKTLVIDHGVTTIGNNAFNNHQQLISIEILGSVTTIGKNAFNQCLGLGVVKVPDSVQSIDSFAFSNCDNLKSVYFDGDAPAMGNGVFEENTVLYYIPGTTGWTDSDTYDAATGTWNGYKLKTWRPDGFVDTSAIAEIRATEGRKVECILKPGVSAFTKVVVGAYCPETGAFIGAASGEYDGKSNVITVTFDCDLPEDYVLKAFCVDDNFAPMYKVSEFPSIS